MCNVSTKLAGLPAYEQAALEQARQRRQSDRPRTVWLYLPIAHLLRGKVKTLSYESPATSEVSTSDRAPR